METPMSDRAKAQWNGLCACRAVQITLRWSISSIIIAINLGMAAVAGREAKPWLTLALAVVGIGLNFLWFHLNERSQEWIAYWNAVLAEAEGPMPTNTSDIASIGPPLPGKTHSRVFSGERWDKLNDKWSFYDQLKVINAIFFAGWIIALVVTTILLTGVFT